jgi:dipeptidyl aminopeptidase/acylaminoacyl peptidase
VTVERRERPRPFADLWDTKGTPRPPTTVANPLDRVAVDTSPLTLDEVNAARGVDRGGGIDLSPDGGEVAFAWDRDGSVEIYTAPLVGDRIIQLTDAEGRSVAPRWSPDGHWVAFAREDGGRRSLWVVDRDGEHAREVTPRDPLHGSVTLSPHGIPQWSEDTASPLLAAAGVAFAPGSPRWSPDRSAIAFTTSARGTTKIALAHVRDGTLQRVQVLDATPFEDSDPVWRPDGRGVVYRRHEHGNVTLRRVFTVSHADDAVIDVPGWLFSPQVAPDGETVVAILVDRSGADVVVRPKGGIAVARITRTAGSTG